MKNLLSTIKKNTMAENLNATTLCVAFALTLLMLLKVLSLANVGLDLTDEGYYFNWISNPWLYKYYVSQFGYIYHPIYKTFGDSIVYLRHANILISFGLSWLLSYSVLRQILESTSKNFLIIISASLSLPALYILMITGGWLPSPSYNSLNFQGCLIVALGFVLSIKQDRKQQALAIFLIGLGGWLVFMAKPSTALLLALAAVLYYLPNIKKDWSILVGAGLVGAILLLISAFAIDGSALQFVKRYQGGLLLLQAMDAGHGLNNLFRLDYFSMSSSFKFMWLLLIVTLYVGFKLVNNISNSLKTTVIVILLVAVSVTFVKFFNPNIELAKIPRYHTLIITALTFASILYFIFNKRQKEQLATNKLILLFLAFPYLFAAGSGNNYWQTAAGASVFWVLTSILLLARVTLTLQILSVTVSFVVLVSVINLFDSMRVPYRQTDALLKQTATYIDPHSKQVLVLSSDTAKYLNTLNDELIKAEFKPQTPAIDLTGHHPGTLYFMQARAIGQAWAIGGYSGSNSLAALALNQASCEDIANAWLLIEKDGTRHISDDVLRVHGITLDKATYQKVGMLKSQTIRDFGSINKSYPDGVYMHYLFKPLDSKNQTKNCFGYRSKASSQFDVLN